MPTVKNFLSLVKFSHTIFAMPFAMIGFFLGRAEGNPVGWGREQAPFFSWQKNGIAQLLLVIGCMVFARSAAMAFNRYLDRNFDSKNPRTVIRELPAGIVKANQVLMFTIASALLFIACTFFINPLCFYLSPVALLVVLGYSYTKRFTPFCHLILGLGLSLAPIGAYLAVTGKFTLLPLIFSACVLLWVSGFDIIYALQDEEFDRSQKLYSIPAWLGKKKALRISEILHILCAACVVAAGLLAGFNWLYWIGAAIFMGMLFFQHALVKPANLERVNMAFMTVNGIASVVFAIFVIADLLVLQ